MKKKKKLILGIGIGIISVCIVTIVSILIFFPVYLNFSKMKKDYVESMTDDKMWKIYLIPDSYGFIRGYVVSQASKSPEKIKIWTKEDGTVFRTTKKIHTVDGFDTPAKKYILKGKKVYNFIEAEAGASEDVDIPVTIEWIDEGNQYRKSKASIKYDKWNANDWFTVFKVKLGMDVF